MTRSSRRGVTAVEVILASLILAGAIIPLYLMFRKTGETSWRSEIAYKAMQVAREELEEVRMMPLFSQEDAARYTGHNWQPVAGRNLFFNYLQRATPSGGLENPLFTYPDHYRGIETRVLVIQPPLQGAPEDHPEVRNTRIVRLEVRWQQKGQANDKGRAGTQVYHTVVVNRGG